MYVYSEAIKKRMEFRETTNMVVGGTKLQLFNVDVKEAPLSTAFTTIEAASNNKSLTTTTKRAIKLCNNIHMFVESFSRTTTIHGLVYVMNRGLHFTERFVIILLLCVSTQHTHATHQ